MLNRGFISRCAAVVLSLPLPLWAQTGTVSPAAAMDKARALYYTPVDRGFQGFHCDVNFDWKTFIQKASNQSLSEDDARLRYLQSVHLSVDDEVRKGGALHWNAPSPPPDNTEDSVDKIREGLQQVWSGFLQSWNGFVSGDLMTVDKNALVERTSQGYRVAVRTGSSLAEERFSAALLLQEIHVTTPTLESTIEPSFSPGSEGFVVSRISSSERQLPASSAVQVTMKVSYSPISRFQIPSDLQVTVGPAKFEYRLVNCTVQSQFTSR